MSKRTIKFVCDAAKWFDKINGNTYHSVRITRCRDNAVIVGEFQYGYGDQYKQTALAAMVKAKWLPVKYRGEDDRGSQHSYLYERENNYPIKWNCSHSLKRDAIANGKA